MRRESPDELTRLVVTALAVFIGGTAALVANDTIRAYRLEIAAKQAVIELNKELARQDKAAAQAEAAMARLPSGLTSSSSTAPSESPR